MEKLEFFVVKATKRWRTIHPVGTIIHSVPFIPIDPGIHPDATDAEISAMHPG
jgi:hypothetical protein